MGAGWLRGAAGVMRSNHARLSVSVLVAAFGAGAAASAQLVPRGPEVVVDPEAEDVRYCANLVRHEDGSVAVAWAREDARRESVLVRMAYPTGELGPATMIEQDAEDILSVVDFTAAPGGGFHLLWDHLDYELETLRDIELDSQGRLRSAVRVLRPVPLGSSFWLSLRPGGGFVEGSSSDRAFFVRLLDDDHRAVGELRRVKVPNLVGASILHEAGGRFVIFVGQDNPRDRRETGIRAQRFDAEGRPVGPLQWLLRPHYGLNGFAAAGEDGTLAVSAGYGDLFGSEVVTLSTFRTDGTPLGFRYKVDEEGTLETEAVAIDPEGRVLWVWYNVNLGRYEAQVSSLGGHALSPVFPITERSRPGSLIHCANATWAGSDWVVTWIMARGQDIRITPYIRRFAR